MFHSLRSRIITMSVAVALIAVTCVGLLSFRYTLLGFRAYVAKDEETELERFRAALIENYERQNGWSDAQNVLNQIGVLSDRQLILTDSQRNLLATYPAELSRGEIRIGSDDSISSARKEIVEGEVKLKRTFLQGVPHVVLHDSRGAPVGILYTAPFFPRDNTRNQNVFISSLNRTLILAALASASMALLIAFFLSRRILRPVESLTDAVQRMENGDLGGRVEASSRDEIGKLARAFNSMADNLMRAEKLRRNMVSDVAHELRTPLTNIRCQIETIQDGLARPTPEVLDSLHEETMLLNRLVDDLQDIALAEAGQLALRPERVSVKNAVTQAINALQHQIDDCRLSVKTEMPENCPDVSADSNRLAQILRNLLVNAFTHTPRGGAITISAAQIDSEIELAVKDNGCGIAAEDLPFVFERFYRADSSRSRATGGGGLGLAIVKQIVETHGGKVGIESRNGEGTKIYFTLPVYKS
jgi:signal transduction histidine kinase